MSAPRSHVVRVVEVIEETPDACSFVLEPDDDDAASFAYRPGQFLTVDVPTEREQAAARCYSLSSSPALDEKLKITVKRVADGYASNWLCDNIVAGSTLEVLRPAGTFTPRDLDRDLLLVAGGSGITPAMSILKSALHEGRGRITVLYANRDERSVIFRDELSSLARQFPGRLSTIHWLESLQGLPDAAQLGELVAPLRDREVFLCGPPAFMDVALEALEHAGVDARRVHVERFTSLTGDPFAEPEAPAQQADDEEPASVEVELDGQWHTLRWPRGAVLTDVMLDAGLDAPFSCREGNCSACACILLEGDVEMRNNNILEDEDLEDGFVLGCQSVPVTDEVRVSYDE